MEKSSPMKLGPNLSEGIHPTSVCMPYVGPTRNNSSADAMS